MTNFASRVTLGRTGLQVSRIGLGSAYGVSERGCLAAHDAGVNYFFWGSLRTVRMGLALRTLARRDREGVIIVLQCYARSRWSVRRSVENGLRSLGIDHADILLLGWHETPPAPATLEAAQRLRAEGRVRFLALSSHQRPLIGRLVGDGPFDVYHLRYNAAHPGAERDIFPHLPAVDPPGMVSFTNTRWGDLLKQKNMPPGDTAPSATDCYRFVLSSPHVQVAISGPRDDRELADALAVLERGPLDDEEMARMRRIGAHVHGVRSLMSVLS